MQSVTPEWKSAMLKTMAPRAIVYISMAFPDNDTTPSSITPALGGLVGQIINDAKKRPIPTPIIEQNYTLLRDPTNWSYFNNNFGYKGGELSDINGDFADVTGINYNFSSLQTEAINNITIVWSRYNKNQYAKDFTITIKDENSNVIHTETITGNTNNISIISLPSITNYQTIELRATKWSLPYNVCVIDLFFLGTVLIYDESNIISLKHKGIVDPLNFELPRNSVEFVVDNKDEDWNPYNPQGNYALLTKKCLVHIDYGFNINGTDLFITGGNFYLSGWDTPQNGLTVTFTAQNPIYFMNEEMTIAAGTYTYKALIRDALDHAGVKYDYSNLTNADTVTFSEAVTLRECEVLQLACNAACASLTVRRDGTVYVKDYTWPTLPITSDYSITQSLSFKYAEYEMQKEARGVSVNNGLGEYIGSTSGEMQTINNDFIKDAAVANKVAQYIYTILSNRNIVNGQYRADPRMDCLDEIFIENKYAVAAPCVVSEYEYTFKGMVHGYYKARVIG